MNGLTTTIDVGYGDAFNVGVRKPSMSVSDWLSVIDKAGASTERVTSLNAIRSSATWAPIMVIGSDVGQIPFRVMRTRGDETTPAERHEVDRLLRVRPNPWQTPTAFKEWAAVTTIIWGNALVEIQRDVRNRITALVPIYPDGLSYDVDEDGTPFYYQVQPNGELRTWELGDVLHFRQFGTNGFWGLRLVEIIADEIGLNREVIAHANTVFQRGVSTGLVLEHPGKLGSESRAELRKSLEALHGGSANAGRPMMLWEGMKASTLGISNVDAQLIELIEGAPVLIARMLRVPPHKIGDYRHSSVRANLEDSQKEYFASTLARPVSDMREEMEYKLFAAGSGLSIKPDPTELLKGDLKTQMETAQVAMASTVWTRNEARAYVGSNPVEGGDVFVNPNTTSGGGEGEGDPGGGQAETVDTDEIQAAARSMVAERAAVVCEAERDLLSRRAKSKSYSRMNGVASVHGGDLQKVAERELAGAVAMAGKLVPVADLQQAISQYVERSRSMAESYAKKSDDKQEVSQLFRDHWPVTANAKRLTKDLLGESNEDN